MNTQIILYGIIYHAEINKILNIKMGFCVDNNVLYICIHIYIVYVYIYT